MKRAFEKIVAFKHTLTTTFDRTIWLAFLCYLLCYFICIFVCTPIRCQMPFKILIIGALVYILYRMSLPKRLDDNSSTSRPFIKKEKPKDDIEYIDYEELD